MKKVNQEKWSSGFPTSSDTIDLYSYRRRLEVSNFGYNYVEEELFYLCNENKGTDKLCSY